MNGVKNFNASDAYKPHYYRAHVKHLGFIEESTISNFGFSYNGKRYASVKSFYQPWRWENTEPDPLIYPWVIFFQGIDDTSWFKRFANQDLMDKYWEDLDRIDSLEGLLHYN